MKKGDSLVPTFTWKSIDLKWVKLAKSNEIFIPLFSRYSYFFVTFEIVRYFVTWKVTSYSNAVTCNALL